MRYVGRLRWRLLLWRVVDKNAYFQGNSAIVRRAAERAYVELRGVLVLPGA